MEPYEDFYKKQFASLQGQAFHSETASAGPQRVSVIQFHGVAVLSPLLTVEKRQEMQQYRQKAIEVNHKRQSIKKTSLLNRVQEILDTVQVKPIPSVLSSAESATLDQSSTFKNMNGFAILPNAITLPVRSQNGPAKFEKSIEELMFNSKKELKPTDTSSTKECNDCAPLTQSKSPVSNNIKLVSVESTDSSGQETSQSDLLPTTKDAPDPYVMSLQNLLKKSREYIEREQSRRSMKGISKGSSTESHSDKENDTIKISDSLKEKARLANRSRSCSPLMVDKPSLNKSNTLLQTSSSQGHSLTSSALSAFSKVDILSRPGTSSGLDTESDEELRNACMLEYESSIIKSLTGSYAKLPSPELSLSPKMHRRRPRPLSAGNIVINHPINAYDLSPKEKGKVMDLTHPETNKKTSLSEFVPTADGHSAGISSNKRPSFSEHIGLVPSLNKLSRSSLVGSKMDPDNRLVNARTVPDGPQTPVCRGIQAANPDPPNMPETNMLSKPGDHADTIENVHKTCVPLEVAKHNSPAELNKSYDVETPSPILMQSQSTNQATDTPSTSLKEQFLESNFDAQVKRRLELDLDSTQRETSPTAPEENKRWLHERNRRRGSLHAHKSEVLPSSALEGNLKKKMLDFEEMRKKLEEQHAYQLSLLIAEQEREQERLQREFEEEGRRLRFKEVDQSAVSGAPDSSRTKSDWNNRRECSVSENITGHLDDIHSMSTVAPSQHSHASTNESSFIHWGPAESRAPKISATRPLTRAKTRWSQVYSPQMQRKFNKVTALAKGFLTRRLMQTEKLKNLKQTVQDTADFIRTFRTEAPLSRGTVSVQDISLQERVIAQLRAALYEIHDIFFTMDATERMNILLLDRELRREKLIRQMEKMKSPRDRLILSSATQKSLDRKKLTRAVEIGMSNRKPLSKPKALETRILQPSQGQNAPINKLLCRQGSVCKKNLKKEAKCCDNLRRQHSLG
ncbi:centriolar coiled-coil protein of 110 kDa [Mixophyes fleayi]|uniref:centriolar coiled-coil protein of 110 kDa n=1 Tax=Mixophyes fleayi TaxID=3061075 RepID=UPI003F4DB80F